MIKIINTALLCERLTLHPSGFHSAANSIHSDTVHTTLSTQLSPELIYFVYN